MRLRVGRGCAASGVGTGAAGADSLGRVHRGPAARCAGRPAVAAPPPATGPPPISLAAPADSGARRPGCGAGRGRTGNYAPTGWCARTRYGSGSRDPGLLLRTALAREDVAPGGAQVCSILIATFRHRCSVHGGMPAAGGVADPAGCRRLTGEAAGRPCAFFAALAWLNCYSIEQWESASWRSAKTSVVRMGSFFAGAAAFSRWFSSRVRRAPPGWWPPEVQARCF